MSKEKISANAGAKTVSNFTPDFDSLAKSFRETHLKDIQSGQADQLEYMYRCGLQDGFILQSVEPAAATQPDPHFEAQKSIDDISVLIDQQRSAEAADIEKINEVQELFDAHWRSQITNGLTRADCTSIVDKLHEAGRKII